MIFSQSEFTIVHAQCYFINILRTATNITYSTVTNDLPQESNLN